MLPIIWLYRFRASLARAFPGLGVVGYPLGLPHLAIPVIVLIQGSGLGVVVTRRFEFSDPKMSR